MDLKDSASSTFLDSGHGPRPTGPLALGFTSSCQSKVQPFEQKAPRGKTDDSAASPDITAPRMRHRLPSLLLSSASRPLWGLENSQPLFSEF